MKKRKLQVHGILLCLLICFLHLSVSVQAAAPAPKEAGRKCSLTVSFLPEGKAAAGVEFSLYRIGSMTAEGDFALVSPFDRYSVSMENLDADGWRILASTLQGYIAADGLQANAAAVTNAEGQALWEKLPEGIYLVLGQSCVLNNRTYTQQPFILSLPGREADGDWNYQVTAECKYESMPNGEPDDGTVSFEVLKVWDDMENKNRPQRITAELYDGNMLCDSVTLSEENNWSHEWEKLYRHGDWSVREKESFPGYTVTVEKQGARFVITNKKQGVTPPAGNKLPQTGMLWWPVPLLTFAGILCILTGIYFREKRAG